MKKGLIKTSITLLIIGGLSACASNEDTKDDAMPNNQPTLVTSSNEDMMMTCDLVDSGEQGPLTEDIYVVGTFPGANWKHVESRKLSYKGDNIYQAVVSENTGKYSMQYAAKEWKLQFTAKARKLTVGTLGELARGGYGTDTSVEIPEAGQYVWSLEFTDKGAPLNIVVAKCE